jgi:nicotinate-nucleotide adenylyltransferase
MIGIYGGTFNPVHYGHLRTALEVKELFNLEQLRLIPCHIPAHRDEPDVSAEMRLQMLQLAIADAKGLQIDRRELDRQGPSYMVDTLQSLRQELGAELSLVLFIGADAFAGLPRWHQYRRLFDYAHIVVMTRPGFSLPPLADEFQQRLLSDAADLQNRPAGGLFFQTVTLLDISATQIREIVATGHNPQFLLPASVLAFIYQHQLYRATPLTTGNKCKVTN